MKIMTFEEFVLYRDIKVRDDVHERIVRTLYSYLSSVSGNNRLLPNLMGHLLGIDASSLTIPSCCFNNNIFDFSPPYDNADCFAVFSNSVRIYIYGRIPKKSLREVYSNEYAVFMLSENLEGVIERKTKNHIYLK